MDGWSFGGGHSALSFTGVHADAFQAHQKNKEGEDGVEERKRERRMRLRGGNLSERASLLRHAVDPEARVKCCCLQNKQP